MASPDAQIHVGTHEKTVPYLFAVFIKLEKLFVVSIVRESFKTGEPIRIKINQFCGVEGFEDISGFENFKGNIGSLAIIIYWLISISSLLSIISRI